MASTKTTDPITIRIEGAEKAVADLKATELRKRGALSIAVARTLLEGSTHIKRLISRRGPSKPGEPPGVDTGALRASYRHRILSQHSGDVYTEKEYAPWLEYGTGRAGAGSNKQTLPTGYSHGPTAGMAARPHAGPTSEWMKDRFKHHTTDALKD